MAADHPQNLFTLLGGRYRLHVQEPLTERCPEAAEAYAGDGEPRVLNLILDTTVALPGATAAGFHGLERTEDRAFRWTTAEARIDVPIDRETPPAALDMDVVMTGPPKRLRIEADGCVLFDDTISGRWAESFALDSCRLTPPSLEILLASDTHVPDT